MKLHWNFHGKKTMFDMIYTWNCLGFHGLFMAFSWETTYVHISHIVMKYTLTLVFQIACNGILKYCLRDMLGRKQCGTLHFFLDTITSILGESHDLELLDQLGDKVNIALARLERDFPISIQVSVHTINNVKVWSAPFLIRISPHTWYITLWMESNGSDQYIPHGCTPLSALTAGCVNEHSIGIAQKLPH